jgi:putative flippase GtrA
VAPVEHTLLQAPRAFLASVVCSSLDMALLALLVEAGDWHPLVAATFSYLAGGVVQYQLSSRWVFPHAPRGALTGFATFTLLSLVGLAITWGVMAVLVDGLLVNYALAKLAALGFSFAWNFLSRKYLLFTPGTREPKPACTPLEA